jgi:hypothetical protein
MWWFSDEMMLADWEYAVELFTALYGLGVPSGLMCRPEAIRGDRAKVLAAAGVQLVAMGVECGNENFRREWLNRRESNDRIAEAFAACRTAGIFTVSYNIVGWPVAHDDQLTARTVEFTRRIKPGYAQWTFFYPLPGAELYDYCVERDLIDPAKAGDPGWYGESVLRGVSMGETRRRIERECNPHGFPFRARSL